MSESHKPFVTVMLESVHGCDGFNKNRRGRERAGGGYGSHGGFLWFAQAAGGEGSEDLLRASPFRKIMWFYMAGFSEFVFVEGCMFRDPPIPP